MRLSAKVKLEPTQPQRKVLLATLKTANRACNYVSEQAWKHKKFGRGTVAQTDLLQRGVSTPLCEVRERFDLTAQMVVRCIGKVKDAYIVDRRRKRTFKLTAAFPYDDRILSWKG